MAPNSDIKNQTDVVSSTNPEMEETTITGTLISVSSSSNVPDNPLSSDLILEILVRLPLKHVLRFRCICKSINTLTSEPIFTKKHLRVSPTRHHLIITPPLLFHRFHLMYYPINSFFHSTTESPIAFYYPFYYQSIAGSCNGILCFAINQTTVILSNPFIGKFKILPSFHNPQQYVLTTIYGFGYVPAIDVYKVLAIFQNYSEVEHRVKIHTLGTDSWRVIHEEIPFPLDFDRLLKYVSGTLNWLSHDEKMKPFIVSFNLLNELWRKFSLPDDGVEDSDRVVLCVLKDCLSIFATCQSYYAISVMKEYGKEESWTRLWRVSYFESPFTLLFPNPLWIFEDQVFRSLRMDVAAIYGIEYDPFYKILMFQSLRSLIYPRVCIESLISP